MKTYAGAELLLQVFLTSELCGGVWSTWHTGHFTPCETVTETRRTEAWVELRAGLDAMTKKWKSFPRLCCELNSIIQHVASSQFGTKLSDHIRYCDIR
jgi:hypothetical protein